MRLRQGVIKATPNRKCYTWYVKMCMLDSNSWCLNVEIMHSANHLFEMANINVESEDPVLLKERVIHSHHIFEEIW